MLFFLMLKSLLALRAFGTMVTSTTLLAGSLSKLFWPMVNYHRSHKTASEMKFLLYMIRSIRAAL